jgi:beta-galactosidase
LHNQQKFGANYQSVFNIVWYGIQPLPLGKRDVTKPIDLDEGIFFGKYQEGIPGMQPERLGPYVSTLNPGYDLVLPLYRPWPMFEAIRDANTGNTNSPWSHRPDLTKLNQSITSTNQGNATVSYLPGNGNFLAQELSKAGVKASVYSDDTKADFLLVDGSTNQTPDAMASLKNAVDKVLDRGGTVWIWNITPSGAAAMSKLLGREVLVEARAASSFVVRQNDPLLAGLDNASLYFAESDDWRQMAYGLGGEFLKGAQVLLEASVGRLAALELQS